MSYMKNLFIKIMNEVNECEDCREAEGIPRGDTDIPEAFIVYYCEKHLKQLEAFNEQTS